MQVAGPVPTLSPRALEQLTSLATDAQQGFARLRAIARLRNQIRADLVLLEQQLRGKEDEFAALKGLAEQGRAGAAEQLARKEPSLRKLGEEVSGMRDRCARMDQEEDFISAWLHPANRLVEGVVKHLGQTRIEHLLPDIGFEVISRNGGLS